MKYFILNDIKKISSLLIFFLFSAVFFQTKESQAKDIIFEGYYKILLGQKHIGYAVQQYSYDKQKKQFHTSSYIKTNMLGGGTTEGLKAVSNNKFLPISYKYTSQLGKALSSIDASFKINKNNINLSLAISNGKTSLKKNKTLPRDSFLSSFQTYLMLQKGFKVGDRFKYSAVAEEDGKAYSGQTYIKEEINYRGQKVYRVLNEFKGSRYISLMNKKGEVLKTTSPLQNLSTELVSVPALATNNFKLDLNTLKFLFGQTPKGLHNSLSIKKTSKANSPPVKASAVKLNPKDQGSHRPDSSKEKADKVKGQ